MLYHIVRLLAVILIPAVMQMNLVGFVSTSPEKAAEDFMNGLKTGNRKVISRHIDNEYVNFLINAEGGGETAERINEALFRNFTYKIEKIGTKNDVAVARILVENSDFSNVESDYEKKAYKYITDNLYNDKTSDKKTLSGKCLELYINQIEKAADKGADCENVVYVPMIDDGYYGWNIVVTDELMHDIMGNFELPAE
ncbi:MAG: hypothetical protein PUF60_00315 [Firmicutes bacterium]|nr:hypothetical protein [Bacillota bacterium]